MKESLKYGSITTVLKTEIPQFEIKKIKKIGEGDNSKAFLINEEYIFRFPKRKDVKYQAKKEAEVLPIIRSLVKVNIPSFKFISKKYNFTGYKILPGKFLTKKSFDSQNKFNQKKIIIQIAEFLNQLHHINPALFDDSVLETMDLKQEYSEDFINTQKLIFPKISAHQGEIITALFSNYLNAATNFSYAPTLIHNDFSINHILLNPASRKLSGIIDFGDMAFGDADYDFMYLFDCFGKEFIEEMLGYYKHNSPETLFKKLTFFSLADKLQTLMVSIKENDKPDIKDGFKKLSRWIDKWENLQSSNKNGF